MKVSKLAMAIAVAGCLPANVMMAQNGAQPSVQRTAYEYGSYYDEEEVADISANSDASAPLTGGYLNTSCDTCDAPCDSCGSDCGGSCGGGFSLKDATLGKNHWLDVGGWTQLGYHNKSTVIGTADMYNKHPGKFNLHQQWFYLGKEADGRRGWDWGFRTDVIYGVDAQDTQAFGNNPGNWDFQNGWDNGIYGWAMPQLYGEVENGDLNIKFGRFFTLVGYEVVAAPQNFFYSRAFTTYNSEPFTHTGVLATYTVSDNLTTYGGWTYGWDTGFDQFQGGSSFLGGFSASLTDDVTFTYISTAGDFGARGNNGYSHSLVFDFTLSDRLNYILQSDLVSVDPNGGGHDDDVGINQYLLYTLNDCWRVGSRLEWWKDEGRSHYSITGGVNYRPTASVVVRPEIRHNWAPSFNQNRTIFGIDTIFTF